MHQYENIKLIEEKDIVEAHLQWPVANRLNQTLLSDFRQLMDYLEDESWTRLIAFRGLESHNDFIGHRPHIDQCSKWEQILRRLEQYQGASIVCINGRSSYFHLQLALACDYRIATNTSSFEMPEISKGYLPGMALFRLAKYIGIGAARDFSFSGKCWSATKAADKGLIDYQCDVAELENVLQSTQAELGSSEPEVLHYARRLLNESFATPYEQAIGNFLAAQDLCLSNVFEQDDHKI